MTKYSYSIEDAIELANLKGGLFLTENEVIRVGRTYLWQCAKGHKFTQMFVRVNKDNSWCPHCRGKHNSLGEAKYRALFEKIFNKPFVKQRPKWLINITGYFLELDGYNQDLGIAFEFQGDQHYKFIPSFHKTNDDFIRQLERDKLKVKKCIENNVKLFIFRDNGIYLKQYLINEIKKQAEVLKIIL